MFIFSTYDPHSTHTVPHSTGRTGSLTGSPSIRLGSYATLDTTVTRVLERPYPTTSPSLTLMVGTKYKLGSVPAAQTPHRMSTTGSYSGCDGTQHPSLALEQPFLLTSWRHITNSRSKVNSTCMTSISPLYKNQTIKDGRRQ